MFTFTEDERRDFKEASADGFDKFPDGEYESVVTDVEPYERKGSRSLLIRHKIRKGAHTGKEYVQFMNLGNANQYGFIKSDLHWFGIKIEEIELDEVGDLMSQKIGFGLTFDLVTDERGKYQNMRIKAAVKSVEIDKDDDMGF